MHHTLSVLLEQVHFSVNAQDKRQIIKWLLQHPQQRVLGDAGLHATYDGRWDSQERAREEC